MECARGMDARGRKRRKWDVEAVVGVKSVDVDVWIRRARAARARVRWERQDSVRADAQELAQEWIEPPRLRRITPLCHATRAEIGRKCAVCCHVLHLLNGWIGNWCISDSEFFQLH